MANFFYPMIDPGVFVDLSGSNTLIGDQTILGSLSASSLTSSITNTTSLTSSIINTTSLTSSLARINSLTASFGNITSLTSSAANISSLTSSVASINILSASSLAVDTDVLFVDSVNNRVGINTKTPAEILDVVGGHLKISSGFGIKFENSSTNAILDDYEFGTWTPEFSGSTTGGVIYSYGTTTGQYIKIGKVVIANARLTVSDLVGTIEYPPYSSTPPAGELRIKLPLQVNNLTLASDTYGTVGYYLFMSGGVDIQYTVQAVRGTTYAILRRPFNTILDSNVLNDGSEIEFSITYLSTS